MKYTIPSDLRSLPAPTGMVTKEREKNLIVPWLFAWFEAEEDEEEGSSRKRPNNVRQEDDIINQWAEEIYTTIIAQEVKVAVISKSERKAKLTRKERR